MDKITDFAALRAAQSACLRPGLITNCVLSAQTLRELCESGRLLAERTDGGLFLLARGETDRFYFYVTAPTQTRPRCRRAGLPRSAFAVCSRGSAGRVRRVKYPQDCRRAKKFPRRRRWRF